VQSAKEKQYFKMFLELVQGLMSMHGKSNAYTRKNFAMHGISIFHTFTSGSVDLNQQFSHVLATPNSPGDCARAVQTLKRLNKSFKKKNFFGFLFQIFCE